ncbi:MAG: glutamate--tRNA ligase family protein, partial [Firmicutes bacterium]|nr:glutamate--tRNA ligase family protein [Bacillota bacterium]
ATSVQEFRDQGYLPEALVNYLALLGWSPGENINIFPWEEMPALFSLDDVSRSAAIYDLNKLAWMNGCYLASAGIDSIIGLVAGEAREMGWLKADNILYFTKVVDLVRGRAKTLNEILGLAEYFFADPLSYDSKGIDKYFLPTDSIDKLLAAGDAIRQSFAFTAVQLEESIRLQAEVRGWKASAIIHPARLALTGRTTTPGLFEIIELLGPKTSLDRIERACAYIRNSLHSEKIGEASDAS